MKSLEERLETLREGAVERISPELRKRMHRATEELEASGAVERAVGEDDEAPRFSLPNSTGESVDSSELLERGPLVLAFFRGHW